METVKKLLYGDKHDETAQGTTDTTGTAPGTTASSGTQQDHAHTAAGLTGPGTHLATQHDPSGTSTSTAGPHDSNLANKADPRVDSDRDGSRTTGTGTGTTGLTGNTTSGPHSSDLANRVDPRTGTTTGATTGAGTAGSSSTTAPHGSALLNKLDPRIDSSQTAGHTSNSPGLTGTDQTTGTTRSTGTGLTGNTSTAGPHDASVGNKLDPRVDSDRDGSRTAGTTGTGTSSDHHHDRDAAGLGAASVAAEEFHQQHEHDRQGLGSSNTGAQHKVPGSFPSDSTSNTGLTGSGVTHNTGLGSSNPSSNTGLTGSSTTAGPHDSNIANKLDPRVDSDRDGSRTTGNTGTTNTGAPSTESHHARDAAAVGAFGAAGAGAHHHHDNQRDNQRDNLTSSGTEPMGTSSNLGSTGTSSGAGLTGGNASTAGPHDSNIANKLDPRVDSDRDGSRTAGSTGTSNTGSTDHHYGRDAAAVGAVGTAGAAAHHHHDNQREDLTGAGLTGTDSRGIAGTSSTAAGPHSSNTANKLDPRVDSDRDGSQTATSSNTGTSSTEHHYGRDAAAVGGLGAAGAAAHHHHDDDKRDTLGSSGIGLDSSTTGPSSSTTTAGPHDSNIKNKLDPKVDSDRDGSKTDGTTGTTSKDHHLGRDAAVGAGGVELAEHGHHKHDNKQATGLGSSIGTTQPITGTHDTTSSSGHHYGRDAAVGVGGVGLAEHEHKKHDDKSSSSTVQKGDLPGPAPKTAGPHRFDILNKLDPRVHSKGDKSNTESATENKDHHYGRDAAGVGAVGAGAYEADKHHDKKHDHGATTTAGPHSSDAANKADPRVDSDRSKEHHHGRDAAVAGGVGGAAYEAEQHHKHDKDLTQAERDAKRDHKHELKEEKRHHKEEVKHHKEEVKHHKEEVAAHKHAEHDEKKHHKEELKAENEAEKSHHGRDAAAVGAVGAGAYGAEKNHHGHEAGTSSPDKPLPAAPGNHGIGTGAGPGNALAGDNTTTGQHGFLDNSPGQHDSHLGRDAALAGGAGAGAYGLHEHNKHQDQTAHQGVGTGAGTSTTHPGHSTTTTTTTGHGNNDRHLGRDAAVAGGAGVEAAGLASHHNQSSTQDPHAGHTHGAGAVPLDEKPRGKDLGDILHGADRNRGVAGASGLPGTEGYGSGQPSSAHGVEHMHGNTKVEKVGPVEVATGEDGRSRLHKDPKEANVGGGMSGQEGYGHGGSGQGGDISRNY